MTKRQIAILVSGATVFLWMGIRWFNSLAEPDHVLGVSDGRLAECPDRPNCVCSQDGNPQQRIEPIGMEQSPQEALARIESVVRSMPRSRIISSEDGFLHAEFSSLVFGFVDDVEFLVDATNQQIHVRSAARSGYSDLGVNRKRVDEIRRRYQAR